MLAQRISSINSLSALCEKTGAKITELSKAIGMDRRIGPDFLKASVGFGGSCFKKDILNLVYLCQYYGLDEVAEYWNQVIVINNYQINRFSKKIINELDGNISNKTIAILGWAFKKNTNDSRESASIYVSVNLLIQGASLNIYDPMVNKKRILDDIEFLLKNKGFAKKDLALMLNKINVLKSYKDAIEKSVLVAILTEWDEFKDYKWDQLTKTRKLFDGRNLISSADYSIGI